MSSKPLVIRLLFRLPFFFGIALGASACGQSCPGNLRGTVQDPSGALVPSAQVAVISSSGFAKSAVSGADGSFYVEHLIPGRYSIAVTASGFAPLTVSDVLIFGSKQTVKNFRLKIVAAPQQVQVTDEDRGVDVSPDRNGSALIIKGKDLDALSDDPDELQNELNALAGPAAGPSGGQIYIDGFTGGQLPPKSSIREIRINQNPFSAQYDKLGFGRIEILTRPGTDKLHGSFLANGNDSSFNSRNPFVTGTQPAYYSTFLTGNASGSLTRDASWFASVFRRDSQSTSIVNAELLDANGNTYNYSAAVPNPQTRLDVSPRIDLQLSKNNTLSIRYMYDRRKETDSGVTQFALPSQAYDVLNQENTLQVSDTQVLGTHWVNETRFQYLRARDHQTARNTDATITVQGAFTSGGNNSGVVRDNQDRFELQNYVAGQNARHVLNFGARLRLAHQSADSTSGFNGIYVYNGLAAYAAKTPTEYDVTAGKTTAAVNLFDAAFFYQDDFKARSNLTLSYGLRYEGQNRISNLASWAPRVSLAYGLDGGAGRQPKTILRVGYGWFFDRFGSSNVLQAIRENGTNQRQYVVKNPTFYQNAPTASQLAALSTAAPTIYQVAPNLKAAVNMQAAVGVDRQLGKTATVSLSYINSHGIHQYYTDNVNAYLPDTYNLTAGTGVRPNGVNENIYQYQSGGIYNQNQLLLNYSVRAQHISLFGFYALNFAKADTSGASYFPSDQFNPGADYGRANFDVRNRFLLGGNVQAPFGVSLSPILVANSSQAFNITVGEDLNGDNQFNDRPSFAAGGDTNAVKTSYGTFNLSPAAGVARIPYNYGNGPAEFSMNLRLSKSFGIGPRREVTQGASSGGMGPGGPGGAGPPGGGGAPGGGGGLGPGGLGGKGGPPQEKAIARRYTVGFSLMGRNIFNKVNAGQPVGVLSSPLFGRSNSLAGGFFSSPSSNRSLDMQLNFSF